MSTRQSDSIKVLLLLILLCSIMLGGMRASSPEDQEVSWTKLPTGTGPVAIAVTELDGQLGWDLIVVNNGLSDIAYQNIIPVIQAKETITTAGTQKEIDQLKKLEADITNYGTVAVLYGSQDGRFWPGAENLMYKEVAVNKVRAEGILRAEEKLFSIQPATLAVADRDNCGVLVASNRSPYIFNLKGSKLGDVSLANWNNFTQTQRIEDLQFPVGDLSMAVADFDSDGHVDLAMTNTSTYTLSIYKGDDNCNFFSTLPTGEKTRMQEWVVGSAGDEPRFVTVGDLNNDGNEDLVVAKGGILSRNVYVVLGSGDGTFRFPEPKEYAATQQPRSLVIGDFNNDGNPDLVVAGIANLVFLQGDGDGTFTGKQPIGSLSIPADLEVPVGIVVEDFNRDSNLDVAVANIGADSVDIYLGNGDGTFSLSQSYPMREGTRPIALAAEDLDWDGDRDLAVANYGTNEVAVLLNQRDGTFERWMRPRFGWGTSSLTVGNFNGGDISDLAVTHLNTKQLYSISMPYTSDAIITEIKLVGKVTVEHERIDKGNATVLYGGNAKNGITLLKGEEADGSFQILKRDEKEPEDITKATIGTKTADVEFYPTSVAASDFKEEEPAKDELAVTNFASNSLSLCTWDSRNELRCSVLDFFSRFPRALVRAVTIGDFDNDGHEDLGVANYGSNSVFTFSGNGKADFQGLYDLDENPATLETPNWCHVGKQPSAIAAGDFNNDGYQDLAVANFGSDDVSILLSQGEVISLLPDPCEGTFQLKQTIPVGKQPSSIAVADFDQDGNQDLAVANFGSDSISILLNNGDGSFALKDTITVGMGPISITPGYASYMSGQGKQVEVSLNEDDIPDLAVANFVTNDISILLGKGDGTFEEFKVISPIYNIMKKDKILDCKVKDRQLICEKEAGELKGEPLSIANGPLGVTVGFFDDWDKADKTLDLAVAVEFPAHYLRDTVSDKDIYEKLRTMWQDIFIVYGPLQLEEISR